MANLIGQTLSNRYRIDDSLGRGGMAEVYKVWDNQRTVFLALKMLRQDLAEDTIFLRRFRREAQNLEKLQHPNIVRFYGIERDDYHVFMLMDYIDGTTLQRVLFMNEGHPQSQKYIVQVMQSLCAALNYAHSMGLVHCDIKPGNIMIDKPGKVLLTDFGVARMTDAATSTMVGFGTPAYMAPELVRGRDPTPQSDIYSLGVVLYEMVTGGERPFTGEQARTTGSTSEKVRWEQVHLDLTSPRQFNPHLSPDLEQIILKCLDKDPQKRFSSTPDLMKAMEDTSPIGKIQNDESIDEISGRKHDDDKLDDESKDKDESVGKNSTFEDPNQKLTNKEKDNKNNLPQTKSPHWILWIIAAVFGLGIIGLMIGIGGNLVSSGISGEGPLSMLATLTSTNTATPTKTLTPTLTLTPTPTLGVGSNLINQKDEAEMVFVPEGDFQMGSDYGASDESPKHTVYLDAYWIYKHEVTNSQYAAFLNSKGNQEEDGVIWFDAFDDDVHIYRFGGKWVAEEDFSEHPVVEVSWFGANAYCEWMGGRLPTEAEWEKAAKGEIYRKYPWGNENPTCNMAHSIGCSGDSSQTLPVGSLSDGASPYGALDMAGNVWEWVGDWYDENYYESSPDINPQGPESGKYRILRGGSWNPNEYTMRVSYRMEYLPVNAYYSDFGFRCILEP